MQTLGYVSLPVFEECCELSDPAGNEGATARVRAADARVMEEQPFLRRLRATHGAARRAAA